jgi:FKBP-type peptidyl-prolyl cis-trans isomerase FkpA
MRLIVVICILFSGLAFYSCGQKKVQTPVKIKIEDDQVIKENKEMTQEEKRLIDSFVKRNKYDMIETGTGVRYMIYEKGNGPAANSRDIVLIDFDIKLLDGTMCYTSRETGAEEFTVDYDNVESGLHEAIKFLHAGDKAIIIIPQHKAFGLAGDMDRIPPYSTLVYNLHLLDILKKK